MSCKYNEKIMCNDTDNIKCVNCPCQLAVEGYVDRVIKHFTKEKEHDDGETK